MEDKNLYGDVDVDKATRTKIYDFITKPVHKDSNGNYMTARRSAARAATAPLDGKP